jgi:uncharacterized protein (TIGR02246 family)
MFASASAQDDSREAAIRAIIADQVTAWDAGDGEKLCQSAAPDISAFNTCGNDMSGKELFCHDKFKFFQASSKGLPRSKQFDDFVLLQMMWLSWTLITKFTVSRSLQAGLPYQLMV